VRYQSFERSGKIIAMAGLNPAVYQSGKHEGKGRITKRGNRHLRRIIWLMTTKVIQYTDIFNAYYQNEERRLTLQDGCIGHCS